MRDNQSQQEETSFLAVMMEEVLENNLLAFGD